MTSYELNKQNIPDLDEFENSKNDFLRDIYKKAHRYNLSDKQVYAANKAWEAMKASGGKTPWEVNLEKAPGLEHVDRLDYNEFLYDLAGKAKRYILSDKQIEVFNRAYAGASTMIEPKDKEAYYMMMKAVSMAMQSSWLPDKVYYFEAKGLIDKKTNDFVLEKARKYRKSIFGHLFDIKKYSKYQINSYINEISKTHN